MSLLSNIFNSHRSIDLSGITDWHCHILPGVDDGVEDMETSLAILADYEAAGMKNVWLTPHIMEDVPNTTDDLKERFNELLSAYRGNLVIRLASENMIDSLFDEILEANDLLPIGDNHKSLLVETSYFNAPLRLNETFEKIKAKGYYPLFAHPERYNYIDSIKEYKRLKNLGVRFQLNLLSLDGAYGPVAKDKSHELLKLGMYDAFGSDLHRHRQFEYIKKLALNAGLNKQLRKIVATSILNPPSSIRYI